MRQYRSAKRKNEVDMLILVLKPAVEGEANPPGYDTTAEPNISVAEMCEPDSVRTSGPDSQDCDSDTSGWQQKILSID